jgi:hypothetical protein
MFAHFSIWVIVGGEICRLKVAAFTECPRNLTKVGQFVERVDTNGPQCIVVAYFDLKGLFSENSQRSFIGATFCKRHRGFDDASDPSLRVSGITCYGAPRDEDNRVFSDLKSRPK